MDLEYNMVFEYKTVDGRWAQGSAKSRMTENAVHMTFLPDQPPDPGVIPLIELEMRFGKLLKAVELAFG